MKDTITLYRGMSLPLKSLENVKRRILEEGMREHGKNYALQISDSRARQEELFNNKFLTTEITRPSHWVETARGGFRELDASEPGICACGDLIGASYYATRHNVNAHDTEPLIVKFNAYVDRMIVDGRDFLYNAVFQRPRDDGKKELIKSIFGEGIDRYLEKSWSSPIENQEYRSAIADLAVQDSRVIKAHAKNSRIIKGRYKTIFSSAFVVKLPIQAEQILGFAAPARVPSVADVSIDEWRSNTS